MSSCPTCGSDKREVRFHNHHWANGHPTWKPNHHSDNALNFCTDPWHYTPPTPSADEAEGFTDEECPAWNQPELDQYVVCLRCDHYQDDCPHECGPEFSFSDVADQIEYLAAKSQADAETRARLERALRLACETLTTAWYPPNIGNLTMAEAPQAAVEYFIGRAAALTTHESGED